MSPSSLSIQILWITPDGGDSRRSLFDYCPAISLTRVDDLEGALRLLESDHFDAILASVPFANGSLQLFLDEPGVRRTPVVVHAPDATLADAVRWTKLGAYHVLSDESAAPSALRAAANSKWHRAAQSDAETAPESSGRSVALTGHSPKLRNLVETIRLVAPRRCTVLITGETGTGKEVVARSIHAVSQRAHLAMVAVNCSALPEHLLEAELFGHIKGAFTGAIANRVGHFEQAHRSTLFLDEIGDMPLAVQAKLLRVLQEREFQRLGSSEIVRVDVRLIAATNADLAERVHQGKFREDLFYRLNVVPIAMPALRERIADVALLASHFIEKICREEGIPPKQVTPDGLDRLMTHDWPGNVRQLENCMEMAVALSGERRILCSADFALPGRIGPVACMNQQMVPVPDQGLDFEQTVGSIERNILEQALRKTGGNKKMAADMLGLKRTTLSAKLKSLSASAAAS